MRMAMLTLTLVVFVACIDACVAEQVITVEQAQQAVRAFETDPGLQFSSTVLKTYEDAPAWFYTQWYEILESDGPRKWNVNAITGEVEWAHYHNTEPDTDGATAVFGPLSRENCLQIAEDFVRAHYADFDEMGFELQEGELEWLGTGWHFEWQQVAQYGALTPNAISLEVNPANGGVQVYSSMRIPTPPVAEPQITSGQAIEMAKIAMSITNLEEVVGPYLFSDPEGTYYDVSVYGRDAQGSPCSGSVTVHAVTGSVLGVYPFTGTVSLNTHQPKSWLDQDILLPVRDLLRTRGYGIYWDSNARAVMAVRGKNRVVLRVGEETAHVNGRTIELPVPSRIENHRVYVHASIVCHLP